MEKGYLSIVLHAHLPYVRHPEFDEFLEEDWLYEAITETYIPLIDTFEDLINDNIKFKVTISLSPTLISMFCDPLLQDRYLKHIESLIELAEKECERTKWQGEFNSLAHMYLNKFRRARHVFAEKYKRNLINAFKYLNDSGCVEVITCGATHGYLPLFEINKSSARAQIKVAVDCYKKHFGRAPFGMWLPECGYNPPDDKYLAEFGVKYFIIDTHGILHGSPRPKYGVFAPVFCPSGVAAFGRDIESSRAVWSAEEGYPGDYDYREFYRDIGFDLDHDYIKPYIHVDGTRINTGIKYFRITGRTDDKQAYDPQRAASKAAEHAGNFLFNRTKHIEYIHDIIKKKPIILSPYDAELYGHWWYEGPMWLDYLFRKIHFDQDIIRTVTPFQYLQENPKNQVITPSMSSWGWKGYSEVWLEGSNDWIYRHIHNAQQRMSELAKNYYNVNGKKGRALNQAARELLLLEASDWPFIMKTGTVVPYAVKRIKDHLGRFTKLYEDIKSDSIDERWLTDVEGKDNIFPEIDFRMYLPDGRQAGEKV
jgi:1,4-alpha-glucan branching enzyme